MRFGIESIMGGGMLKEKISGLQDCMKFEVHFRGLVNPIGDPLTPPEDENKACGEMRAHCMNSSW